MMCIKIECDLASPGNTKYTFGAEIPSLSTRNNSTVSRIRVQGEELITKTSAISAEAKAAAKKADAAVINSTPEYSVNESPTEAPTTGWSSDQPSWSEGKYIWIRYVNEKGDGSIEISSPALMTGNAGESATLVKIDSSRGLVFKNNSVNTILEAVVFFGSRRISTIGELKEVYGLMAYISWEWKRIDDTVFHPISIDDPRIGNDSFTFTVSSADVDVKTVFQASLET